MTLTELKEMPVREVADENCVLLLWATWPQLKEALEVIDAWGFTYKTIGFVWVKKYESGRYFYGLGRWTRGNTEFCLLSTKGKPKRASESVFQLVVSKIREHSRKPDEVRKKIVDLLGDLPRIELFARQRFEGWDVWGNEAPDDIQTTLKKDYAELKASPSKPPTAPPLPAGGRE